MLTVKRLLYILSGEWMKASTCQYTHISSEFIRDKEAQEWLGDHYLYELQPKFRLMESGIRDIFTFWKLSWGLENDNLHSPKDDNLCLYTKTWKTIVDSSKIMALSYIPNIDRGPYGFFWP